MVMYMYLFSHAPNQMLVKQIHASKRTPENVTFWMKTKALVFISSENYINFFYIFETVFC